MTNIINLIFVLCYIFQPVTQKDIHRSANLKEPKMVLIKGGKFEIGDIFNEDFACRPVHTVTLDDFYIGQFEITQKEWVEVMGSNPSYFKGDNLPVEQVSWNDIQKFIEKLNKLTGKKYRLPTESEWEYAARGRGEKTRFGNGKNIASVTLINFNGEASYKQPYSQVGINRKKTSPVGSFSPNSLGLYDMSGNVAEWCSDSYADYDKTPSHNPQGSKNGNLRVIRGGSWYSTPDFCRTTVRRNSAGEYGTDAIGFRLACSKL